MLILFLTPADNLKADKVVAVAIRPGRHPVLEGNEGLAGLATQSMNTWSHRPATDLEMVALLP